MKEAKRFPSFWQEKLVSSSEPPQKIEPTILPRNITTIPCRVAISPSRLMGISHAINPYIGCLHGCVYCYALSAQNIPHSPWGSFLYLKQDFLHRLQMELKRISATKKTHMRVLLSSFTDFFQPVAQLRSNQEAILNLLIEHQIPFTILTKSQAVADYRSLLRDNPRIEVGITLTSLDPKVQQTLEPHASPPQARLAAMKLLASAHVKTYAFLGPIFPMTSPQDIEHLVERVAAMGVSYAILDNWHDHPTAWPHLQTCLPLLPQEIHEGIKAQHRGALRTPYLNPKTALWNDLVQLGEQLHLSLFIGDQ